jgi:membrane protease YdiL (CAAX protease family)
LETVVQNAPQSEHGWLRLAEAVDSDEEQRFCLAQVLSINRRNALARRQLEALGSGPGQSPLLRPATAALKEGRRQEARQLLEAVVQTNWDSELGWLWLAEAVDSREEQRFCLTRVISINRRNALARRRLDALGLGPARSPLSSVEGLSAPHLSQNHRTLLGRLQDIREALCNHPALISLIYLVLLTTAEVLTATIEPRLGLLLHGGTLVILLVLTAATWEHPTHKLLLSLTLAPLVRLLSLSLPMSSFPMVYWYFIVSVPLFIAAGLVLRTLKFSRATLGLNLKALPLQILVALTGLTLGYLEYRILEPEPLARSTAFSEIWLPMLILLICTGFAEELIFRGLMQRTATETLGQLYGILYVSAIFAVLHMGYQSLTEILFVFGVALFFGLARTVTGSILGVTMAHGLTNIFLFLALPFGVNPLGIIASHLCGP